MRAPALVLALTLATAAGAQVPSPGMGEPAAGPPPDAFVSGIGGTGLRGTKLTGIEVIDLDYKKVGEVKDVLIARDGRVEAVIVGVGGFLGMGERDIAVRFEHFLWNTGESAVSQGPSASMHPDRAPPMRNPDEAANRMPGALVNQDAVHEEQGISPVNPAMGPVTTGSTPRATVIAGDGEPRRAQVRLTREQLEKAPEFRAEPRR